MESKLQCPNCGNRHLIEYPGKNTRYCSQCDKNIDVVFQFIHNDCIHEGGAMTVSIHRTRKGAEMAMEYHKNEERKKWEAECKEYPPAKEYPFDDDKFWGVDEMILMP